MPVALQTLQTLQTLHIAHTSLSFPTPDSRLPTPDSRLPTPYSRLPTPYSLLPTSARHLGEKSRKILLLSVLYGGHYSVGFVAEKLTRKPACEDG